MAKISLVVYGSLINKVELQNSKIDILDYRPILLHGVKREFSQEPSYRLKSSLNRGVLNIQDSKVQFINALLIDIYKVDLKYLDQREKGYSRQLVKKESLDFKYCMPKALPTWDIFTYIGKEHKYNEDILPNHRYLKLCLNGAKGFGEVFYKDFLKSTFVKKESLREYLRRFPTI